MLYHHGAENYNVAASAAAAEARTKFESEIERGKARTLAVIEQVQTQVPTDRIVPAKRLNFSVQMGAIKVQFPDQNQTVEGFHRHAIGQAAARADIPMGTGSVCFSTDRKSLVLARYVPLSHSKFWTRVRLGV